VRPEGRWLADGRARHLVEACEASRRALGAARIALYQLHAPDPRTPLATSVRALARLKRDGLVQIIVPDLKYIARLIVDDKIDQAAYTSNAGPITPLDMLFGLRSAIARGLHYMAHKTGFVATSLDAALRGVGFAHIAIYHVNWDLLAIASTHTPLDAVYMPPIMRQLLTRDAASPVATR